MISIHGQNGRLERHSMKQPQLEVLNKYLNAKSIGKISRICDVVLNLIGCALKASPTCSSI